MNFRKLVTGTTSYISKKWPLHFYLKGLRPLIRIGCSTTVLTILRVSLIGKWRILVKPKVGYKMSGLSNIQTSILLLDLFYLRNKQIHHAATSICSSWIPDNINNIYCMDKRKNIKSAELRNIILIIEQNRLFLKYVSQLLRQKKLIDNKDHEYLLSWV